MKQCPSCGSEAIETERRLDGITRCQQCGRSGKTSDFFKPETFEGALTDLKKAFSNLAETIDKELGVTRLATIAVIKIDEIIKNMK